MACDICKRPTFEGEGERCSICRRALACFCHTCKMWLKEHGWKQTHG
jgi:hypothetical protein